jgi:hypothetical protein
VNLSGRLRCKWGCVSGGEGEMRLWTTGEAEARGDWRGGLDGSERGIDGSAYLVFIVADHEAECSTTGGSV